jgi:transcriptional regulator with XRE-family HTH domain
LEMFERIKYLRTDILDITQEKFADKIRISRPNLGSIETNRINITDRVISDICREFNINEDWIRYGIGEMFTIRTEDVIHEIENKFAMGDVFKKALSVYLNANEITRKVIDDYLYKVFKEVNKED